MPRICPCPASAAAGKLAATQRHGVRMRDHGWKTSAVVPALSLAGALIFGSAASAQNVVRVGAPLPLTGPLSPEGVKQKEGYDLWAETANAKGGITVGGKTYKVEIVYVDYASNTPRAVQAAERLITDDKVNFLFSPFGSGAAKAASNVSEKYGIPTIAATASSAQVYDQGYKYLFGTFTPNDTLTEPLADIVIKRDASAKRAAILARNDLFPLAIGEEMQKSAKKRNLDVVMFEKYSIGTMDHASALTQMRAAKPDWIFATVTMIAGPAYKEYIDAVGPLAENISSAAWWHPAVRYDGKGVFGSTENFNKLWSAKSKDEPDYAQASAAAAGEVLQLAIEKAGTLDPAKVRDALAALDTTTFFGRIKFGPTGQISSLDPPVFQLQGGKPVVIFPDYVKQADFKFGVQ
jgi:branched-chain amino acid transport system substrate-binding protein